MYKKDIKLTFKFQSFLKNSLWIDLVKFQIESYLETF